MFTQWIAKKRWILPAAVLWMACPVMLLGDVETAEMPTVISDVFGNRWDIVSDGTIMDGGADQFDTASELTIDNAFRYEQQAEPIQQDDKTHEVVLPVQKCGELDVSRRVYVDEKRGLCRWVETLSNPSKNAVKATVSLRTGIGQGIQTAQNLVSEKKNTRRYGYFVSNHQFGFVFIGSGRDSKIPVQFSSGNEDMSVRSVYQLEIPATKTVSIIHGIMVRKSSSQVSRAAKEIRDSDFLAGIPAEVLKTVVNFKMSDGIWPEMDILKPTGNDVVEMVDGDRFVGVFKQDPLTLDGAVGKVSIPLCELDGVVGAYDAKRTFLAVLKDHQVLSGKLPATLKFTLSDNREISIPSDRIARIGLKQVEPEEPVAEPFAPMVALRSGPCYQIGGLEGNLDVVTRFGRHLIPFAKVNRIVVVDDDNVSPTHQVTLNDGTTFGGIVLNPSIKIKGDGILKGKSIEMPLSSIYTLAAAKSLGDPDRSAAALGTVSDDVLVGTLKGTLKVGNDLGKFAIDAGQIRRLEPAKGTESDVNVTLWDNSKIAGELGESELVLQTAGGLEFKVPLGVVVAYDQPIPAIPQSAAAEIRQRLTKILALEDEEERELQFEKLRGFGSGMIGVIRAMSKEMPEEKQQILSDFGESLKSDAVRAPFRGQESEPEEMIQDDPEERPFDRDFGGGFEEPMFFNKG